VLLFKKEKIQFKNNVVLGKKQADAKKKKFQKKLANFMENLLEQLLNTDVNGKLLEKTKELKDVVFIQDNAMEKDAKKLKNVLMKKLFGVKHIQDVYGEKLENIPKEKIVVIGAKDVLTKNVL